MESVDLAIGDALSARTAGLRKIRGVGPPDMCYLKKYPPREALLGRGGLRAIANTVGGTLSSTLGSTLGGTLSSALGATDGTTHSVRELLGAYHHVLGLPAFSVAPLSAYVAELAQRQDAQAPNRWTSAGAWEVTGGVYCCWDAFGQQDLRVHISIPGGVRACVVRPDGSLSEVVLPSSVT